VLGLGVALGSRPTVQARRLLVAAASGGTGFLLLAALGYGLGHPDRSPAATFRLVWCAVPLALTVHLAVRVARTEPSGRLHAGLTAAGLGRTGLPVLAAVSTALNCALGSVLALLVFLHLRGDLAGSPFDGTAAVLLGGGRPLPVGGTLVLLAAVPVGGALVAARCVPAPDGDDPDAPSAVTAPGGLPWGSALTAIGLAVAVAGSAEQRLPLPGGLGPVAPMVLTGWAITATGMVLAGPGLVHACGRVLSCCRPSALRLLAGRALQEEAACVGRPLGALCAVICGIRAAAVLHGSAEARPVGPLTGLAVGTVALCALSTAVNAAAEARWARRTTTACLRRLGAPAGFMRGAIALRAGLVLAVVAPLTWLVAELAVVPLR
jgi:hypothetical protein